MNVETWIQLYWKFENGESVPMPWEWNGESMRMMETLEPITPENPVVINLNPWPDKK